MSRLATLLALPVLALALWAAACGGSSEDDNGGDSGGDWSAEAIAESQTQVRAQAANSQLGVGPTRLAFGLFTPDGSMIHGANVTVQLFKLDGETATPAGQHQLTAVMMPENTEHEHADGTTHIHNDPLATVYVANVNLDKTQWWGAELSLQAGDFKAEHVRMRFFVSDKTSEPAIGADVPHSEQPVARDVQDIREIDSSTPPVPELHQLTVAEALANGKPTLIAFATPAFCQTRFCGPVVETVVVPLQQQYGEQANFVHIEPYELAEARQGKLVPIPEMQEWGLPTEPWVFLIDRSGKVAAKFEGITSFEEVQPALQRVIDGQPAASY